MWVGAAVVAEAAEAVVAVAWLCGCVVEAEAAVEPVVEKAKDWKTGGEGAAVGQ